MEKITGIDTEIKLESNDQKEVPFFTFKEENYDKREDLILALVKHWDDAKKVLFEGDLRQYFSRFDPLAEELCKKAEILATQESAKDDMIFWSTMSALNPKATEFYWKGRVYQNLQELGRELLEHLRKEDKTLNSYVADLFQNSVFMEYVKRHYPDNDPLLRGVRDLEGSFQTTTKEREKNLNLYLLGYMLSSQKVMYMDDQVFRTIDQLHDYMEKMADSSFEGFQKLCHRLVDYDGNLDCQFESWLIALGKREELKQWKQKIFSVKPDYLRS